MAVYFLIALVSGLISFLFGVAFGHDYEIKPRSF